MRSIVAWVTLALGCSAAMACSKKSGHEDKLLRVFPEETDLLIAVNGPALRQAAVYEEAAPRVIGLLAAELPALRPCAEDLSRKVDKALIGFHLGGNLVDVGRYGRAESALAVVQGIRRSDLQDCAAQAKAAGAPLSFTHESAVTMALAGSERMPLLWLEESSILSGPDWTAEALKGRAASKSGLDKNKRTELLSAVDRKAPLWVAYLPPGGSIPAPNLGDVYGAWMTVDPTRAFKLSLGLRLSDERKAKEVLEMVELALPQFRGWAGPLAKFFDKLKVTTRGRDLLADLVLTEQEVTELKKEAAPFFEEMAPFLPGSGL